MAGAPLASGLVLPSALAGPTPAVDRGPFYPPQKPEDSDADLTLIRGHSQRAAGQVVEVSGRVLALDGKPIADAIIEIWQANHHGRYAHPGDTNPAPLDPNFQGYALVHTDSEGRYKLRTIKPGAYPAMSGWTRPPHIHFDVRSKASREVTQMFFPGESLNDRDRLFLAIPLAERSAVLARMLGVSDGVMRLEWDIVLPTA
jgi:protocatechuate 3,4-dioxygenase beta subunit